MKRNLKKFGNDLERLDLLRQIHKKEGKAIRKNL